MPTLKPLKSLDRVTSFKLFTLTNQIFISQVYGSFLYDHFTELYTSSVICGLFMCRLIILRHKCVYIFILQPMYLQFLMVTVGLTKRDSLLYSSLVLFIPSATAASRGSHMKSRVNVQKRV